MRKVNCLQVWWLAVALFSLLSLSGRSACQEELPVPQKDIPGIASSWFSPAIDGDWWRPPEFQKEWGWTKAAVISDFVTREEGKPAKDRTEVRLFYNAQHLYLAVACFDSDMEAVRQAAKKKRKPAPMPTVSPAGSDLDWLANVFEIFIRPDPSVPSFYQLAFNPAGHKFDQALGKDATPLWDGRWNLAVKRFEDRWQAEVQIEIASLAREGELRGTPRLGSNWEVTFCRSSASGELSSWGKDGWHRPKNGRLVSGTKPPATVMPAVPLTLPERSPFHNEFWFCPVRVQAFYGQMTLELFEQFASLLGRYRCPIYPMYPAFVQKLVKVKRSASGNLDFDFKGLEPYLEISFRHGLSRLNITFTNYWQHWGKGFYKWSDKELWEALQEGDIKEESFFKQYLLAIAEFLEREGYCTKEQMFFIEGDEPWAKEVRERMRPGYVMAKEALPWLKRTAAATYPGHPGIEGLDDIIDIWCPQIREFDPSAYANDKRELWMYSSLNYGKIFPQPWVFSERRL